MKRRMSTSRKARIFIEPLSKDECGRGVQLPHDRLAELKSEALRLMRDGFTQKEIRIALNCTRSRISRWCGKAVSDAGRASDLALIQRPDATLLQKFWARVELTGDCWIWAGVVGNSGYGKFTDGHKNRYAHRISYELFIGPIEGGNVIDHVCQIKACVNPNHLRQVTQSENLYAANGDSDEA